MRASDVQLHLLMQNKATRRLARPAHNTLHIFTTSLFVAANVALIFFGLFLVACGFILTFGTDKPTADGLDAWLTNADDTTDDEVLISPENGQMAAHWPLLTVSLVSTILWTGGLVTAAAVWGLVAVRFTSSALRRGYVVLLISLLIGCLLVSLFGYLWRQELRADLTAKLVSLVVERYNTENAAGITRIVDWFQREFKCCGIVNATEFAGHWVPASERFLLPDSCCRVSHIGRCNRSPNAINSFVGTPCIRVIWAGIVRHAWRWTLALAFVITCLLALNAITVHTMPRTEQDASSTPS